MKADDSSLAPEQLLTVRASARLLLDKGGAWGKLPTPVDQLMGAAGLQLAPISAFDENAMRRFLRDAGDKAAQLLKGAIDKVLGIFDVHADLVHIDHTLYKDKQTFLKLPETGHKELPHQRGVFKWIQDCSKHLEPSTAELFEREANTFASIVLFQDSAFADHTIDEPFGIKVPMAAAKKFGSSLYAAFREYVRKHHKICAVLILEPTKICPNRGPVAEVRRIERSPRFQLMFDSPFPEEIMTVDDLFKLIPFEPKRMTRPRSFALADRNGDRHDFVGEGFRSGYHTIILVHAVGSLA